MGVGEVQWWWDAFVSPGALLAHGETAGPSTAFASRTSLRMTSLVGVGPSLGMTPLLGVRFAQMTVLPGFEGRGGARWL
jgi:hypothetical protein